MLSTPPVKTVPQGLSAPIKSVPWQTPLTVALVVLAGLVGMGILAYSTSWGPAVGGDATVYLQSARNLLDGRGLGWYGPHDSFHLLPYSPPFYPLLLAGLGLTGVDLVDAARWLNILLYGAVIVASGLAFYRFLRSAWMAVGVSLLMMASPVMLNLHVWAMSDALFTLTGLLALVLLLLFLESGRRGLWMASAALAGLSFLTRYAGAAFVAAGAAACLLLVWEPWRQRWVKAILYGLVGSFPTLVWIVYDIAATGAVGSRQVQSMDILLSRLQELRHPVLEAILSWVPHTSVLTTRVNPPYSGILWASLFLLFLVSLGVIYRQLRRLRGGGWLDVPGVRWLVVCLIFVAFYAAVVVMSHLFTYPPITLSNRILSPIHWGGLFVLFSTGILLVRCLPRWTGVVVGGLLLVFLQWYGPQSQKAAMDLHRDGLGYTGAYWQASDVIAEARRLPPSTLLVTNELTAIMFLLDRPAYAVQEIYSSAPLEVFTRYGEDPEDEAQAAFRSEQAALLLFTTISEDLFELYGEDTSTRIAALTDGLYRYYLGRDGGIYFYAPPQ